jgi:hypothetical protein
VVRKEQAVIIVRQVFQAKFGKGGELAAALEAANVPLARTLDMAQGWRALTGRGWRVLTDLSGPFDTVELEREVESLAEWERIRREIFGSPEFRDTFARTVELIDTGRTEFFTVAAQG